MYIENLKILDCTIRDGGLVNKHQFSHEFVARVFDVVSAAGVDTMEIGYKNSRTLFDGSKFGPWKFSDDADVQKVLDLSTTAIDKRAKIAVMADVGRVDMDSVKPASESPVDIIRTASYVKDIDKAIAMNNRFHEMGYETAINIMALSRDGGPELDEAICQVEQEAQCEVLNIVDSFGYFFQDSMRSMIARFKKGAPSKILGFHGHNNMQMAFSNSIEGIINGLLSVDATIYGIGRGAGNCTLELLLGFLKNPKYDIRPVLDIIGKEFIPLRQKMEWGYLIPYMISGALNNHPGPAIEWLESQERDDVLKFYEKSLGPEVE
jgi:4-hydroxy 2-oxovalerate aldolase